MNLGDQLFVIYDAVGCAIVRPFLRLPLKGVGAEIGVFKGQHAKQILARHPEVTMLYCVDPFQEFDTGKQIQGLATAQKSAHKRLKGFDKRVTWVQSDSSALRQYNGLVLDFAYIDGDHRYEVVKGDIEVLWPLIRSGGVLGGHDFKYDWPGVIKAVTEFSLKNQLTLNVHHSDWWVMK